MGNSYRDALADPFVITRKVVAKGLDSQTAFAIVSIDIPGGANIGARLQSDQAEADIRIARAHADKRRAQAVAREQEMVAFTRENEAIVVMAEAEIPAAIAAAFRKGQLRAVRPSHRRRQSARQSPQLGLREIRKTVYRLTTSRHGKQKVVRMRADGDRCCLGIELTSKHWKVSG